MLKIFSVRDYKNGDLDEVARLHGICFRPESAMKFRKLFRWLFFQNPSFSPKMRCIVAESDKRIIGFLGIIPWKMKIKNMTIDASFSSSLMTHPEHREMGVSTTLLNRWKEKTGKNGICLALGVAEIARQREISAGFNGIDVVKHHVKIMHPFVNARDPDGVHEIGGMKKIEKAGKRLDDFCRKAMEDYENTTYKDSRYLKWRYFQHPEKKYWFYVALKDGEVRGYIALDISEGTFRWGRIIEIFTFKDDNETKQKLMDKAICLFKKEGCRLIRMMSSREEHAETLKKSRFFRMNIYPKNFLVYSRSKIPLNPGKWFINGGDSDISI